MLTIITYVVISVMMLMFITPILSISSGIVILNSTVACSGIIITNNIRRSAMINSINIHPSLRTSTVVSSKSYETALSGGNTCIYNVFIYMYSSVYVTYKLIVMIMFLCCSFL